LAGLFLPILQGFLFLGIGILLIGKDTPLGRWLLKQVQRFRPGSKRKPEEKSRPNRTA
jgi:hypothetical protein